MPDSLNGGAAVVVALLFGTFAVRFLGGWAALTRAAKDREASDRVSRGEDPDD